LPNALTQNALDSPSDLASIAPKRVGFRAPAPCPPDGPAAEIGFVRRETGRTSPSRIHFPPSWGGLYPSFQPMTPSRLRAASDTLGPTVPIIVGASLVGARIAEVAVVAADPDRAPTRGAPTGSARGRASQFRRPDWLRSRGKAPFSIAPARGSTRRELASFVAKPRACPHVEFMTRWVPSAFQLVRGSRITKTVGGARPTKDRGPDWLRSRGNASILYPVRSPADWVRSRRFRTA